MLEGDDDRPAEDVGCNATCRSFTNYENVTGFYAADLWLGEISPLYATSRLGATNPPLSHHHVAPGGADLWVVMSLSLSDS